MTPEEQKVNTNTILSYINAPIMAASWDEGNNSRIHH